MPRIGRLFLDFEASSLEPDSYPIEIGWVNEKGEGASYLIKTPKEWSSLSKWSYESEKVHKIPQIELEKGLEPHEIISLLEIAAKDRDISVTSNFDRRWMNKIYSFCGRQRMEMKNFDDVCVVDIIYELMGINDIASQPQEMKEYIKSFFEQRAELIWDNSGVFKFPPAKHRAYDDALQMYQQWKALRGAARRMV